MIVEHGLPPFALLGGSPNSPEGQARLEGYERVLERHGIPFDPALVACGNFQREPARKAMADVVARGRRGRWHRGRQRLHGCRCHRGAAQARAPGSREVPVTVFDDTQFARLGNPPLTTVRQPFEAMADAAMNLLHEQLANRHVPAVIKLGAEVVVRRSCGCNIRNPSAEHHDTVPAMSEADYCATHRVRPTGIGEVPPGRVP